MPEPFDAAPAQTPTLAEQDEELLRAIARRVVRMGLTVPAVLFLEMGKPLSYVGSQAMVFFAPVATALFPGEGYNRLSRLFENRENVERLLQEIEGLDTELQRKQRAVRRQRPRRRWPGFFRRLRPRSGDRPGQNEQDEKSNEKEVR